MLRDIDIFPLFVLDGGAFFSTVDRLGAAGSRHFLDAMEDGSLLGLWREGSRLVWDKVYDQTHDSPCQTLLEQHVWLNRLYFLLPIAQQYYRTQDEKWARLWHGYFADWVRSNPCVEADLPDARTRTKYTWFDMQITWRLLVMIHSVQFLAGSKFLKKKHWRMVYDAIDLHSRRLYHEAHNALINKKGHGNHFLQHGTALIYTGALFPELPDAGDFVDTGRRIVKDQLDREILPDGGSIEGSPSYSHFIARLYLDACLLLKHNDLPGVPGLERGIKQQYRHLATLATPAGRTLQVSDSYSLDVEQDLDIARRLFPLPKTYAKRSACFPDSQMMVMRSRGFSVYVDAMPVASHHIHQGKPNILIYAGDEPLLIDSGCSSYDRELWQDWYRSASAHNVVLVRPAGAASRRKTAPSAADTILIKKFAPGRAVIESRIQRDALAYTWRRSVTVNDRKVTINDVVEASREVLVEQLLHVAPVNTVLADAGRRAVVQLAQGDVRIDLAGSDADVFELSHSPAIGQDNRVCIANRLVSKAKGKRVSMKVSFTLSAK